MTVTVYPLNIWTRGEFDRWMSDSVKAELSARRRGQSAPTEQDIEALMLHIVREINWNIVPAGNA